MYSNGPDAFIYDENGVLVRQIKDKHVVRQVAGERELWAKAYAAAYSKLDAVYTVGMATSMAAEDADLAVAEFRKRYK